MGKTRNTKKQNNKETAKTRQRKKQKIKHDDTKEDSNSSNNLNTQAHQVSQGSQRESLINVKEDFLLHSIASVDLINNMEVDWLRIFLVDMLEAKKQLRENFGMLKEKKESNKKSIEDAESKLMNCQEQKRELSAKLREVSDLLKSKCDEEIVCKEALANAKDESTKIAQTIKSAISKANRFLDCSPVDDLFS